MLYHPSVQYYMHINNLLISPTTIVCVVSLTHTSCFFMQLSRSSFGTTESVDLIPGGSKIPVTKDTRQDYVHVYVKYVMTDSVKDPYGAFARGFLRVCGGEVLVSRLMKRRGGGLLQCNLAKKLSCTYATSMYIVLSVHSTVTKGLFSTATTSIHVWCMS